MSRKLLEKNFCVLPWTGFELEPSGVVKNCIISKENISIPQVLYTTKSDSFSKFLKDAQDFVKIKEMNKLNIFKT